MSAFLVEWWRSFSRSFQKSCAHFLFDETHDCLPNLCTNFCIHRNHILTNHFATRLDNENPFLVIPSEWLLKQQTVLNSFDVGFSPNLLSARCLTSLKIMLSNIPTQALNCSLKMKIYSKHSGESNLTICVANASQVFIIHVFLIPWLFIHRHPG